MACLPRNPPDHVTMNGLTRGQSSGADAGSSSPAASVDAAAVSLPNIQRPGQSSPHKPTNTFQDPFTGVPSVGPDMARLFYMTHCEPRYCVFSIPGSLFFLYFYADPWLDESRQFRRQVPSAARAFRLGLTFKQDFRAYTRLYSEWLFSGCAPSSLARLHRNPDGSTSVSFSERVRACLYLLRRCTTSKYALNSALKKVNRILDASDTCTVSDELWFKAVLATEQVEFAAGVWPHAYPTPTISGPGLLSVQEQASTAQAQAPSTVVQNQPFRGAVSLQPALPDDVTPEWTLWTPVTVPEIQRDARMFIHHLQHLQSLDYVGGMATAGQSDPISYLTNAHYFQEKSASQIRRPSPDAAVGAEEEDRSTARDRLPLGSRRKLAETLTQARHKVAPGPSQIAPPKSLRGLPRKSATLAPNALKIRLAAPPRPSTPEQVAAFEEFMIDSSPTYTPDSEPDQVEECWDKTNKAASAMLRSDARYLTELLYIREEKKRRRSEGLSTEDLDNVGFACEGFLYNPRDWQ